MKRRPLGRRATQRELGDCCGHAVTVLDSMQLLFHVKHRHVRRVVSVRCRECHSGGAAASEGTHSGDADESRMPFSCPELVHSEYTGL